jgi:hypothetical protein
VSCWTLLEYPKNVLISFTVLKAAEMYRAEELEKYLKEFKKQNGELLDILIPTESPVGFHHHESHCNSINI